MYTMIGNDGGTYGPVSTETLRQWIRDGRANAGTRVRADDSADWIALSALPEFQDDLAPGAAYARRAEGPKTSSLAIASLALGGGGAVTCGLTAVAGLILGVVGLVRINSSRGHLKGTGLAVAGIVTSASMILFGVGMGAVMLLPSLAQSKAKAQSISCVNNLKQIGLATRIYSLDNADTFPTEKWCDLLRADLGSTNVLICPARQGIRCGYAYNSNLLGRADAEVDPGTVMFFESDAGWNAVGGPELMIRQPRHLGLVNVCLADGSVLGVAAPDLSSLRWEP